MLHKNNGLPSTSEFTVVVPVCNEACVLQNNLSQMVEVLRTLSSHFEVLVCENGSTDSTFQIAEELQRIHPELRIERLRMADYGRSLLHGIMASRFDTVIILISHTLLN